MRTAIVLALLAIPGVATGEPPGEASVAGEWKLVTDVNGSDRGATLTIEVGEGGVLTGRYVVPSGLEMKLSGMSFEGGLLKFVRDMRGNEVPFEAKVEKNRLEGAHSFRGRKYPVWGARGKDAIAALEAERKKAHEPDPDIEKDYEKRSRRAVPRDAFPVLFDPILTPAAEATDLEDDELVIGIEMGGDARAYPVLIMGKHELVNDTCHGTPIAASW